MHTTLGPTRPPGSPALDCFEGYSKRTGSGYVVDAFWSAWDAFAGAKSYRETIDTTACI